MIASTGVGVKSLSLGRGVSDNVQDKDINNWTDIGAGATIATVTGPDGGDAYRFSQAAFGSLQCRLKIPNEGNRTITNAIWYRYVSGDAPFSINMYNGRFPASGTTAITYNAGGGSWIELPADSETNTGTHDNIGTNGTANTTGFVFEIALARQDVRYSSE